MIGILPDSAPVTSSYVEGGRVTAKIKNYILVHH